MNSTLNFIDGHQISYAVAGACALFLFLLLLFELLRTRLYWIYEPRVHRDDYKSKTPPAGAARNCVLASYLEAVKALI